MSIFALQISIVMKQYLSLYNFIIIVCAIFLLACTKEKKSINYVTKTNSKGLPILEPLKEEMPKLSNAYIKEKQQKVAHFFDKVWTSNDNVSFLVAQNGQIIYENYKGFANRNKKEDITRDTPLHIASVSKVLTATAVLMLVNINKIKLDQKVAEFLPDFPYPDVTIQMLLNHRSGMKNYAYFTYKTGVWDIRKELTNFDIVTIMKKNKIPQESKTNTRFSYCNTNYAMLALIIEKVTKMKYPEAMQEMIFKPLGMTKTFVYETAKHRGKVSLSYKGNMDLAVEYLDGIYGDKNIYSTPRDLLKFDKARYAPTFLNPELLKKIYHGYSYEKKGEKNYGLGIRMLEFDKGEPFYYHNGWWHGNTSCFINMRKEKVSMFVISNKYTHKTYQTKKLAPIFGNYPFKSVDDKEE